MNLLFANKINPNIADIFISRSKRMSTEPDWTTFLSDLESGLSAYQSNPFGCFSWFQFCPDVAGGNYKTINGKIYYFSDLYKMTDAELLNLSFDYLEEQQKIHGRFSTYYDMYFAILYPEAIGKPDDYVLKTSTNNLFDLNKNGSITVGEVKKYLDNRVKLKVPTAYWSSFFQKKNIFQLYFKEILLWGFIIALIIVIFVLYRTLFK